MKNSPSGIVLKKHRTRMPYKRFSRAAYTFLITHSDLDFRKIDFFNTRACFHQPRFKFLEYALLNKTAIQAVLGSVIQRRIRFTVKVRTA